MTPKYEIITYRGGSMQKLIKTCGFCGSLVKRSYKFCPACGDMITWKTFRYDRKPKITGGTT